MDLKKAVSVFTYVLYLFICAITFNFFFEKVFIPENIDNQNILADIEQFISYDLVVREWSSQTFSSASRTSNRKCTVPKCINVQRCLLQPDNKLTIALQPILELGSNVNV